MSEAKFKLSDDNFVPYYHQIKETLRSQIEAGHYAVGDLIPSEAELQRLFGVSRATIRHAIEGLVAEGLLDRKKGKGTLVAGPKIKEQLPRLVSFTEEIHSVGRVALTRVLSATHVVPPARIAQALQIGAGEKVLRVDRLRLVDGEPLVILASHMAPWVKLGPEDDFSGSLYAKLENDLHIQLGRADQVIESLRAPREYATLLGCEAGDPVLAFHRVTYTKDGRPVEYVDATYRGDRYQYAIQLER